MEVVYLILLLVTATLAQQNKSIGKKNISQRNSRIYFLLNCYIFQDGGIAFVVQWMGKWSMIWTQLLWTATKNVKHTKTMVL